MRTCIVLSVAALACVLGCAPDPQPQTWTPVDVEAQLALLDSPTGSFSEEDIDAVVEELERVLPLLVDTQAMCDELLRVAADLSDVEDAGVEDAGVTKPMRTNATRGTRFHVLVSCPGPDGDDVDFGHGSARIDTPTLQDLTDHAFGKAGDFLLTLNACGGRLGEGSGSSPGYYDVAQALFVMSYDVSFAEHGGDSSVAYEGPLHYNAGSLEALVGESDDSYRVTIEAHPGTALTVTGATQQVSCSFDAQSLEIGCD